MPLIYGMLRWIWSPLNLEALEQLAGEAAAQ